MKPAAGLLLKSRHMVTYRETSEYLNTAAFIVSNRAETFSRKIGACDVFLTYEKGTILKKCRNRAALTIQLMNREELITLP